MMNIFLLSIYESNLNKPEKEYLLILIEMLCNEKENLKQFKSHYKSSGQVVRINTMDEFIQKSIANDRNHDTEMMNQVYDFINAPMSHEDEMKENPDLIEQRKEFRRKMKKHVKPGNHVNVNELEVDQYAANKVGILSYTVIIVCTPFAVYSIIDYVSTRDNIDIFIFVLFLSRSEHVLII